MSAQPARLCEVWRGPIAESVHYGHIAVAGPDGELTEAWGDAEAMILPRSSAKMIQGLPLVASGAADARRLTEEHLALACASHQGAPVHVDAVSAWLADLGLDAEALRCGPQPSRDKALRKAMIRAEEAPSRIHNNCSGKHAGFLTLNAHLKGECDYCRADHPVQEAAREAFEVVTDRPSPGYGIDGCSAPNFATTMSGMARAMAWFATAHTREDTLSRAGARLRDAMIAHPMLVAGEGRACTSLMQAAEEPVALKTGAEGYFVAILPERGVGIAVKAADGATRAAECAIAAVLARMGVLSANHPVVARFLSPEIRNWDGLVTGQIRPAPTLVG